MSSSNYVSLYQPGDGVFYSGSKLRNELTAKDGKPFKGWIHAPVKNQPGAFVVWFPDTKESDSYIIGEGQLTKARPPKAEKVQGGPIVEHMPTRRKKGDDE